jgi:NitT/TauT family transport system permease protein
MTTYEVTFYVRFLNIPGPVEVLAEMAKLATSALFYTHILTSLERVYLGFVLAACLGIPCGILVGWSRPMADLLFPIIELLRPIPAVAWVPLAIMLWPTERSSIVYITGLGCLLSHCPEYHSWRGTDRYNPHSGGHQPWRHALGHLA